MSKNKRHLKVTSIFSLFLFIALTIITCEEDPISPQGKQYPDNSIPIFVDESIANEFFLQRWSPNGSKIALWAFDTTAENYDIGLYTINSDGSNPNLVYNLSKDFNYDPPENLNISWSPDGQYISFILDHVNEYNDSHLYYISINGGDPIEIDLPTNLQPNYHDWSPDGEWIVFGAYNTNIKWQNIYKIKVDGTELTQLTFNNNDFEQFGSPRWSPDGEWIVCGHIYGINAYTNIIKIRSNGSDIIPLTGSELWVKYPCWSPDGEWVAYSEEVYSVWNDDWEPSDIWVVKADGNFESYQITNSHPDDTENVLEFLGDICQDWDRSNGILFSSVCNRDANTGLWRIEPKEGVDFQ
jgi:TolB protein